MPTRRRKKDGKGSAAHKAKMAARKKKREQQAAAAAAAAEERKAIDEAIGILRGEAHKVEALSQNMGAISNLVEGAGRFKTRAGQLSVFDALERRARAGMETAGVMEAEHPFEDASAAPAAAASAPAPAAPAPASAGRSVLAAFSTFSHAGGREKPHDGNESDSSHSL